MVDHLVQRMGSRIHLVEHLVIEKGKVRLDCCLDPHLGLDLACH